MICYNYEVMGIIDAVDRFGNPFKVEIRNGNCLAIFLVVNEDDTRSLYSFVSDEEHLNNMLMGDFHYIYDRCLRAVVDISYSKMQTLLPSLCRKCNVTCFVK